MNSTRTIRMNGHVRDDTGTSLFVEGDPTLWPLMLVSRWRSGQLPFPMNDPGVQYTYFARNGVFELAQHLGLGGQEVLFPAYFHGVELEALLEAGIRPRFFPVRARMRVEPEDVLERITPDTRAIYLIHYVGFPGPVAELREVCRERGLLLIEDCALALLSCLGDTPLGSFGDAAIFSLHKTLPVPNGAATIVRSSNDFKLTDEHSISRAATAQLMAYSLVRNLEFRGGIAGHLLRMGVRSFGHGLSRIAQPKVVPVGTQRFERSRVGLAMSEASLWLLKTQDMAGIVHRRRRNYERLLDRLTDVAPSVLGELSDGICPLFYPIQVPDKPAAIRRLRARRVATVNFWAFHHPLLPLGMSPEVDELRRTVLELPCHQDLTLAAVDRVAEAVREVVAEVT